MRGGVSEAAAVAPLLFLSAGFTKQVLIWIVSTRKSERWTKLFFSEKSPKIA